MQQPNVWDELSRRFYGLNRNFLKRATLEMIYGGETDPWLDHLIATELDTMMKEEGMAHGIRS